MGSDRAKDTDLRAADIAAKPASRVIKRYSNRKLYDTARSKYVTLDEISQMIKAGDELAIIDNDSKEDITAVTLTQIIFEEEKRENRLSLAMLRSLIQTGGTTLQDFLDRSVVVPVTEIRDSAQKTVESRVEELRQSAAQLKDVATRSVTELTDSARRMFSRQERKAEDFKRATNACLDELEHRLASRIEELDAHLNGGPESLATSGDGDASDDGDTDIPRRGTHEHVANLRKRLADVARSVDALERIVMKS